MLLILCACPMLAATVVCGRKCIISGQQCCDLPGSVACPTGQSCDATSNICVCPYGACPPKKHYWQVWRFDRQATLLKPFFISSAGKTKCGNFCIDGTQCCTGDLQVGHVCGTLCVPVDATCTDNNCPSGKLNSSGHSVRACMRVCVRVDTTCDPGAYSHSNPRLA